MSSRRHSREKKPDSMPVAEQASTFEPRPFTANNRQTTPDLQSQSTFGNAGHDLSQVQLSTTSQPVQAKRIDVAAGAHDGQTSQLDTQSNQLSKTIQAKAFTTGQDQSTQQPMQQHSAVVQRAEAPETQRNDTGLPDALKSGIENLSGMSLDNVKVHYNSAQPAQLNALAYAQGSDIHIAPGQEQHLPHEAWHVVQQAQGRVSTTMQMKAGVQLNDDAGLEHDADVMGARALQLSGQMQGARPAPTTHAAAGLIVQRVKDEAKRKETDARIDELYDQTSKILTSFKTEGQDWKKVYGEKGKEQGKEKTKSLLSGEKPDPTSEIIREGMKQYWATLTPQEKLELVLEAGDLLGQGAKLLMSAGLEVARGLLGSSESNEEEPQKEPRKPQKEPKKSQEEPKQSGKKSSLVPSVGWINDLDAQDVQTLYKVYKTKTKISDKISEIQDKIISGAGDIGESVGSGIGELRIQYDFDQLRQKHQQDFMVARQRYEFVDAAIASNEDAAHYQEELDILYYSLMNLRGPAMIYYMELNDTARGNYPGICGEALDNLRMIHLQRNVTPTVVGMKQGLVSIFGGMKDLVGMGPTKEEQGQALATAQLAMSTELARVVDKSWGAVVSGFFAPDGVSAIEKAMNQVKAPEDKLTKAIKAAEIARGKESKSRHPVTQIFYDAVANMKVDDVQNLTMSLSIVKDVGAKLV